MVLRLNFAGGSSSANPARDAIPILWLRQVTVSIQPPERVTTGGAVVHVPCSLAAADDRAAILGGAGTPPGLIVLPPYVLAAGMLAFPLLSNSGTLSKLGPFPAEILLLGPPV